MSFLLLEYFFVFPSVLVITATVGLSGLPVALRQKILPKVASVLTCVHDDNTWAPLIFFLQRMALSFKQAILKVLLRVLLILVQKKPGQYHWKSWWKGRSHLFMELLWR